MYIFMSGTSSRILVDKIRESTWSNCTILRVCALRRYDGMYDPHLAASMYAILALGCIQIYILQSLYIEQSLGLIKTIWNKGNSYILLISYIAAF
jgi:hypothetical protein